MKVVSTSSEASADSFDIPVNMLNPYNLQTLYTLSGIKVIAQPSNTEAELKDNLYQVPEDTTVVRVTGTATNFGTGAQAKQRQNQAAGAKLRLVKSLKEQVDEIRAQEKGKDKPAPVVHHPPAHHHAPKTPTPPASPPPQQDESDREKSNTDYTKPLDVAPLSEDKVNATFQCRYCKHDIPVLNRAMHEMGCKRNKTECSHCGAYVTDAELSDHIDKEHTDYPCKFCKKNFKKDTVEEHQNSCIEKPTKCRYCEREMAVSVMMYHEATCEAKTEKCEHCGTYVGMNKMPNHLRNECSNRPGAGGGAGSIHGGGYGHHGGRARDLQDEVARLLPTRRTPPAQTGGGPAAPINVDEPTPVPATTTTLTDEELALKFQQEEWGTGGAGGAVDPPPPVQRTSPPPSATGGFMTDEELARQLAREGSGGGVGGGVIPGYNPADFDPPPMDHQGPTMLAAGDRLPTTDEEEMSAALIRALQAEQTQGDRDYANRVGGGGSHRGGGYGGGRHGGYDDYHGGGYGGGGRDTGYRGVGSTHRAHGGGGGRGSSRSPPPRGGRGGGGARSRPGETDEEMARRIAEEEWGS